MMKNSNLVCHFSHWWIKVSGPYFGPKYSNLHANCTAFFVFFFSQSCRQNNTKYAFQYTFKHKTRQCRKNKKKKKKRKSDLHDYICSWSPIRLLTPPDTVLTWVVLLKNWILWGLLRDLFCSNMLDLWILIQITPKRHSRGTSI